VAGCCEHGNELSGYIKGGEFVRHRDRTGSGVHPDSYPMGTGDKEAGA